MSEVPWPNSRARKPQVSTALTADSSIASFLASPVNRSVSRAALVPDVPGPDGGM